MSSDNLFCTHIWTNTDKTLHSISLVFIACALLCQHHSIEWNYSIQVEQLLLRKPFDLKVHQPCLKINLKLCPISIVLT